jgi:hypothetical protein
MALLDTAEKKQDNKEKALREQLESLNETVPQIQTHLSMCKKFTETANKHELLHLYHDVVGHLDWLLDQPYDLTPVDDSHVETNMKDEFARQINDTLPYDRQISNFLFCRCLQPLLMDNFTGASPLLVMPRVDFMVSQILSTADFRGRYVHISQKTPLFNTIPLSVCLLVTKAPNCNCRLFLNQSKGQWVPK